MEIMERRIQKIYGLHNFKFASNGEERDLIKRR